MLTAVISHLRFTPLPFHRHRYRHSVVKTTYSLFLNPPSHPRPTLRSFSVSSGDGVGGFGNGGGSGNGGGHGHGHGGDSESNSDNNSSSWYQNLGLIGIFIKGWKERVAADSQFPFKVLMEEVVGVTSCVIGDMASRPNFGLNELDFVFSTLIVGSILNFTLMYLLAPTLSSTSLSTSLPGIFSTCPTSHMFEPGKFGVLPRLGTFFYKGAVFAAVGFGAGLVGTAISNGLIVLRKKIEPEFESPNKAPPMVLNAVTWALHMGLSSNLRYQTLNGVESTLAKTVSDRVFKGSVVGLRCANNILGGVSFVVLARLTGSQSASSSSDGGGGDGDGGDKIVDIVDNVDDSSENLDKETIAVTTNEQ